MTASLGESMQISMGEGIALTARNRPDRDCFLFTDGSSHTFAETNSRVNRLVSALSANGVRHGDRLAIFALDSHRFVEVVMAAAKLGAVYVPLNYRLTRSEVDVLLDSANPVGFFYDLRYADLLDGIVERHASIKISLAFDTRPGDDRSEYEDFIATGADTEPRVVASDRDLLGLAFTSGTTGLPKGVLQSQRQMKAIVTEQIIEFRMRSDEVRYTAAPAFHITGICQLLAGVSHGFTSLVVPQFDPHVTLDHLAQDKLTGVFMVPTMISTLLQLDGVQNHDYERLELMYYGAAAMSPNLLRRAMDTFRCDFLNAFGAGTEAGLQSQLGPEDHRLALDGHPELLGSIGKPSYGVALRIVDENLEEVPTGEVGEIATRSDMLFDGYLNMPEETERATRGGWFRAGDMGYMDANGYLYLHGRKNDMIVRGGENIYPIEIESVLAEHPAVVQSAAVAVADEHWSEIVRAWIQVKPGVEVTADELIEHCASRLAKYKVPAEFRFVDALPINASGKILKRELREWK